MIIPQLFALLGAWRPVFAQARTHHLSYIQGLSL